MTFPLNFHFRWITLSWYKQEIRKSKLNEYFVKSNAKTLTDNDC